MYSTIFKNISRRLPNNNVHCCGVTLCGAQVNAKTISNQESDWVAMGLPTRNDFSESQDKLNL